MKRAESAAEAARLRREADLLDVAAHPGLVEALAFDDDGPQPVLHTAYVGESVAAAGPLEAEEIAGLAAAVATTLADLHAVGLVHGAVIPSHVLLDDDDGRPVLCGAGYGGVAGERPASVPDLSVACTDPARTPDSPLEPEIDVFGVGVVIADRLESMPAPRGGAVDELRRISEQAMASPAAARPTARRLADLLHDSVPAARLARRGAAAPVTPPRSDPLAARRRHRPLERWRHSQRAAPVPVHGRRRALPFARVVLAGAGGAAVLLVPRSVGTPGTPEASLAPEPVRDPVTTAEGTTTTLAAVRRPSPRPAREGCPAVDAPMTADVDGDGCAEAVNYKAGVVEAAGRRWAVGEPGDVAAVGDWTCSGDRSLALLRPRTGEVFTFAGWATAGHELTAPRTATVAGGRSLRAADLDADGCNELVVERATGAPAVVRLPAAP